MQKKFNDLCESYQLFVNNFNDFSKNYKEQQSDKKERVSAIPEQVDDVHIKERVQQMKTVKTKTVKQNSSKNKALSVDAAKEEISDSDNSEVKAIERVDITETIENVKEQMKQASQSK